MAGLEYPLQIEQLAKYLDLFEFIPGICNAEEYGRHMIRESMRYSYDDALECYYDYHAFGQDRMNSEIGMFVPEGYITYGGFLDMDELMMETQAEQSLEIGGIG